MRYHLISIGSRIALTSAHITTGEFPTSVLTLNIVDQSFIDGNNRNPIISIKNDGEYLGDLMRTVIGIPEITYGKYVPTYLKAADGDKGFRLFKQLAQVFPNVSIQRNEDGTYHVDVKPVADKSLDDSVLLDIDFHPFARHHLEAEGYGDLIQTSQIGYRRQRKNAIKNLIMLSLADHTLEVAIMENRYYVSPIKSDGIGRNKQDRKETSRLLSPPDSLEYDELVASNLFSSEPAPKR